MHADLATTIRIIPRFCRPHHGGTQTDALPHTSRFRSTPTTKERGAALIITLLILLIMTLLGITAITTSSLQEKMAGNMRDQYMAQQAGDSILRDGESWIFKLLTRPTPSCAPSGAERVWDFNCLDVAAQDDTWWVANGYTSNVSNTYVNQNPRYVDEHIQRVTISSLSDKPPVYRHFYRANGWSVGASDYARGLFQSIFSRRSDEFPNH
jgi:type IV pilus assembly protein PilX